MSIGTKQKTPRTNCFYAKNRHHLLSSSNNFYSLTKEKQSEIESMLFGLRAAYTLTHFLAVCVYALGYCLVFPRRLNNTSKLASYMSLALPVLGIKVIHRNSSPVPANQPAVYVANHQDTLDIFIYPSMLPPNIAILGKSGLKYVPIFGLAFWLAGNIFIDRQNKEKAKETMRYITNTIRKRGCSMYMFPEGTRSKGRGLLPFKAGAFSLAIESGLPIVPIVFSSTHKNIDLNRFRAGTTISQYLEPISTKGMTHDDLASLIEQTRNRMQAAIDELDKELAA